LFAVLAALVACPLWAPSASAQGCANEARRAEQAAAYLADCRAYELVTPPGKDSGEPKAVTVGFSEARLEGIEGARAAAGGERMAWDSEYALPGSQVPGLDYLSTRDEGGWSSENVVPPQSVDEGPLCPFYVGTVGWSSDLSKGVLADGLYQGATGSSYEGESLECGHDEPRLVAGEPEGFQDLFVRDSDTHAYQLVNVTPSGVTPPPPPRNQNGEVILTQYFPASFLAGSTDLSHVVFEEELKLTPEAPGGDDLYDWSAGGVHLVTILPDGTPVAGMLAGATKNTPIEQATNTFVAPNIANFRHAVSADGSRIFFQAAGNLYVRENATSTVQLDASQAGGPGGGGQFMAASEDGSRVFFLDEASAALTANTQPGSGANLYEYDLEDGHLTDITPDGDAGVLGVSGASEDGSYVYFVAEGALEGTQGASVGQPNLYLDHAGALTFVATLSASSDSCDWATDTYCPPENTLDEGLTARVSANGHFIGFTSTRSLTGYDNTDVHTGQPDAEVFLYEAATNHLSCASCDPSGAPPSAPGIIRYPARPDTNGGLRNDYPQRNVSDNGQVFFETADELLPAATNGRRNVYEYEHGQLYLISSGKSEADSYFLDASVDGSDVFFATAQRLLHRDEDSVYDIYDARIGGGFPEPPSAPVPCAGEECRSALEPAPAFPIPASTSFSGSGNLSTSSEPAKPAVPKPRPLTRAQQLARALKACRRQPKRKRQACERSARRRYGRTARRAKR
jgi:hypothetical protein